MTTTLTTTRTLHLVDIENLVGDPRAETVDVLAALDLYFAASGYRDGDHVVIAATRSTPRSRRRSRPTRTGASA